MKDEKKLRHSEAWKLFLRALRAYHQQDSQLLPALVLEKLVSALLPFVLIYFSARILNELAGARRPQALWTWAALSTAVGGLAALLKAILSRWATTRKEVARKRMETLFLRKQFEMDYADADDRNIRAQRVQIWQNQQWGSWGFTLVPRIVSGLTEAITGIAAALALTVSLFLARVPETEGSLTMLNSPVFVVALLGVMLLLSLCSGRLTGHTESLETKLADTARLGNRLFGYFGFFGTEARQHVDARMYEQYSIFSTYFTSGVNQTFGVNGPFARLAKGRGGIYRALAGSFPAVFTGCIYVFTCLKALGGAFGVGSITQYVGAATAMSGSFTMLFEYLATLQTNGTFLRQSFDYLDLPNAMYQGTLTMGKRSDRADQVEFRDVSFRYPGTDVWALRHVNVKLRVGSRMAIVGENGSGKTTFIKLLCRLYDPQEGTILLNGIDIRKYVYRDYMDIFSVVFQDFQLLSQPLGSNVAGSAEYDAARVSLALQDAGFGTRLESMPDGLNTMLYKQFGEDGVEVSGGEAQKIAIARALYKNAPFIVLDEPTAALDPITEAEIYERFNDIVGDKTAIYISHRLSSCKFCDEILVFDHGQIVQKGSHDALVAEGSGKYHALWTAQAQYYT